jgi:hypothetical protein
MKNSAAVIDAAARAADVPVTGFLVEDSDGFIFVNHPDSMKWTAEKRAAVKSAVEKLPGRKASVT